MFQSTRTFLPHTIMNDQLECLSFCVLVMPENEEMYSRAKSAHCDSKLMPLMRLSMLSCVSLKFDWFIALNEICVGLIGVDCKIQCFSSTYRYRKKNCKVACSSANAAPPTCSRFCSDLKSAYSN